MKHEGGFFFKSTNIEHIYYMLLNDNKINNNYIFASVSSIAGGVLGHLMESEELKLRLIM